MLKKNYVYRPHSPIRSPAKVNIRAVSPIRCSPFSRQAPMSPLKARVTINGSTTPSRGGNNQRIQLTKSPSNYQQNADIGFMQKTLKSGVGLFQQLAHQNKIGSEKKENRLVSQNTNPFDYSERKRQTFENYPKNSFAALIQNVKQIQSIQASKGNYFNSQVSFKTIDKSKQFQSNIKTDDKVKSPQGLAIIQSFASANKIEELPDLIKKQSKGKQEKIKGPEKMGTVKQIIYEKAKVQKKENPQLVSSFEDVILLIRKASQKVRDDSEILQQEVKMSFEQKLSFNMNPFL